MFETPTLQTLIDANIGVALPAIALAFGTMIVLLVDLWLPEERKHWTPILALSGISASFIMTLMNYNPEQVEAFGGMFIADSFTAVANMVALGTAFLSILISTDYLRRTESDKGEYYTLILLSTSGAMLMAGANDLLVVFIGLELLSIPLYVLAAFRSTSRRLEMSATQKSEEAGMKYFILGAFSSAFFVYGAALVFGATGSTNLQAIFEAAGAAMAGETSATFLLLSGAALMFVGLGFKVAVVPFHMWTPDVYEGAPTPVTAFMSIAAKVGGFTALMRVLVVGMTTLTLREGEPAAWLNTLQLVAIATLLLGNFVALAQTNMKRLLAYSSIAHAGYMLMAVAAAAQPGVANTAAQAMMVYFVAYMFTNIGAFGVVLALEKEDGSGTDINDFAGLYNTRPMMAIAMAVFMFSLTGIPLTAGFLGKWLIFGAAVQAGLIPLVIIGVLTSVVSAFYYVRVIVQMFLQTETVGSETEGASQPVRVAIVAAMWGTLIVGIAAPLVLGIVEMVRLI